MGEVFDPAMARRIELRPVADLLPYEKNARTHSDAQVEEIASSISQFGFNNPILIDSSQGVIAGHGRLAAAKLLGLVEVPVVVLDHLSESQRRAYILADNRLALNAGWDEEILAGELADLVADGFELDGLGFSDDELAEVLGETMVDVAGYSRAASPGGQGSAGELPPWEGGAGLDDIPAPGEVAGTGSSPPVVSRSGDVWILGAHRIMCGDSTSPDDVSRLMNGEAVELLHADPPYGMGKESEGVANDNLRGEKLVEFMAAWWDAASPHIASNSSAYIWGNPEPLWRFWFSCLSDNPRAYVKNQIVWSKGDSQGMLSGEMRSYPISTEHALFVGIGESSLNINSDNFWPGWEPVAGKLIARAKSAGLTGSKVKELTGRSMFPRWFSRSQWRFISREYYQAIASEYPEHFPDDWAELDADYQAAKKEFDGLLADFYESRHYFDNTHDKMCDVWEFPRVVGEERHGHATPKPIPLMQRVMLTSLPGDGLCYEPFAGSGSTLIAAEYSGRRCYTMEIAPAWVDVVVKRWQTIAGRDAVLESTGETFRDREAELRAQTGGDVF